MKWIDATPAERSKITFNEFDEILNRLFISEADAELLKSYARLIHSEGRAEMWSEIYD